MGMCLSKLLALKLQLGCCVDFASELSAALWQTILQVHCNTANYKSRLKFSMWLCLLLALFFVSSHVSVACDCIHCIFIMAHSRELEMQ